MPAIQSILIANRGEIAARIIRTCRRMGISSIAVYSDADARAAYVRDADFALHLGGSEAAESYLNTEKLIRAALRSGADAIHPGYGFLSEQAAFARACIENGLVFIGPHPEAIEAMGSKSQAKTLMQQHGVPVVPGYQGSDQSLEAFRRAAAATGYPVLLKAAAGGGGKGMRVVLHEQELEAAFDAARREAQQGFGDSELLLEKYFPSARHIEFQILGDRHGRLVHLFERECTLQRRHQKIVEESPSPALSGALRHQMSQAALKAAAAIGYDNAGTVEFILTPEQQFYFLEINTRLQVEHPVTEAITGLDLVQLQIEMAEGRPLLLAQEDLKTKGYAVECRLYAEDPAKGFMPAAGKVLHWAAPEIEGLRVETDIESGAEVSVYYDPMIAKLIVHAEDRAAALRKMRYSLTKLCCLGLVTNQDFLLHLLQLPDTEAGQYDTHSAGREALVFAEKSIGPEAGIPAVLAANFVQWLEREQQRQLLTSLPSGWRNNFYALQQAAFQHGDTRYELQYRCTGGHHFECRIEGETLQLQIAASGPGFIALTINGLRQQIACAREGDSFWLRLPEGQNIRLQAIERLPAATAAQQGGDYHAPMPSVVLRVGVKAGDTVKKGDPLITLMSMKMENTLTALTDGEVLACFAEEGQHVAAGFQLLLLQATEVSAIE